MTLDDESLERLKEANPPMSDPDPPFDPEDLEFARPLKDIPMTDRRRFSPSVCPLETRIAPSALVPIAHPAPAHVVHFAQDSTPPRTWPTPIPPPYDPGTPTQGGVD